MGTPFAVIIAKSEHASALKKRLGPGAPVAVFPDTDSPQAGEAIAISPPKVLILDSTFTMTARGATLVARIKAEPHLSGIELRILIEDETRLPLLLSQAEPSGERALLAASRPLDHAGTRRAVRFAMNRHAVVVNGEQSHLVDLSVTGAQLLLPMRVRPTQSLRLTLSDESTQTRYQGVVAWSVAVPVGATVRYRAGVEFVNPDAPRLEAFCAQFGSPADRTFGPS